MTQLNGNHGTHIDTTHEARYEAPAFAPGSAFAWTLRSAEIACRAQQRRRSPQADRKTFDDNQPDTAPIDGSVARYETPAFAPGSAFAWTLRSAEIAHRGRRQQRTRQPHQKQLTLLAAA